MAGRTFPHPLYAAHVLQPSFATARKHLFSPMIAANRAHVLMLLKQGIISRECARALLVALLQIEAEGPEALDYQPGVEDLYFCVERRLIALAGAEVGGNLQLARSRNDLGAALGRLVLRDRLLGNLERLNHFRDILLAFGRQHLETIMPGYTHTQPAQPTTLAHYLAGVLSFLERDATRLRAAYATTNRSPLGAAAFTTSGFPVDRQYVAELLGFAGPMESSYDAIGAADHLTEAVAALVTMAANLSRFTRDLLFWATREAGAICIGDDFVQISSIMPQKRNPVVLEHLRARLGHIYGRTLTVLTLSHNVPYGDTQDIEDEIYEPLFGAFQTADAVLELYAAVFESLEVDPAHLLARAAEGFTTATELADTLVREKGLAFRTAHAIVARLVEVTVARGLDPDQVGVAMLEEAALVVTGRPLGLTEEALRRALDPANFVAVRRVTGGPAPKATAPVLAHEEEALERDRSWLDGEKERLTLARATLDERVRAIAGNAGVGRE